MYNGLSQVYRIKQEGESISLHRVKGRFPRPQAGEWLVI